MAVKRFEKIRQTRTTVDEITGVVEVVESYIVHLDNPREPRIQMMLHRPDLARFQPHPDESSARVVSTNILQRKHTLIYDVQVRWSSDLRVPENPYDEPAIITTETVDTSVPFLFDHEGNPNTNTAGDLLEGAEDDEPMLVFNISKKIPPNYPSWLLTYGQVLNSDSVSFKGLDFKPKHLKLASLRIGGESEQDDVPFLPLQMRVVANPNSWESEFLNRGTQEITILKKPTGNGNYDYVTAKVPILDETGRPVSTPQFLDEDGRRPRVDGQGRRVTLEQELKILRQDSTQFFKIHSISSLKQPLDPEDIITLKRTRKKPRPFNGVLPLN